MPIQINADDTPTYYFYEEGSYTPLVKLDCVATENEFTTTMPNKTACR